MHPSYNMVGMGLHEWITANCKFAQTELLFSQQARAAFFESLRNEHGFTFSGSGTPFWRELSPARTGYYKELPNGKFFTITSQDDGYFVDTVPIVLKLLEDTKAPWFTWAARSDDQLQGLVRVMSDRRTGAMSPAQEASKKWRDYIKLDESDANGRLVILNVPGRYSSPTDLAKAKMISEVALKDLPGFKLSGDIQWDNLGATINLLGPPTHSWSKEDIDDATLEFEHNEP